MEGEGKKKNSSKGFDDGFRRKWDKSKYSEPKHIKDAVIKEDFSKSELTKREKLKARNYLLDLEKKVGKTKLIKKADNNGGEGYYCNVCDCTIMDSINFLDHINGKQHQKNLGMSMTVERSSLDQVRDRIAQLKKEKEEKKKSNVNKNYDFVESSSKTKEKMDNTKKESKKKKKMEKDEKLKEFADEEVAKVMGFGGFSSK